MATTAIKITGDEALLRTLRELPRRTETKVNRRAVNLATTPILRGVKEECPVDEGDLKAAQAKKVYNRGPKANGIVGADADYVGEDGKKPVNYDHLVAFGHVAPDGSAVPANPYIQRGWENSIGEARQVHERELARGIETEAEKLRSQG